MKRVMTITAKNPGLKLRVSIEVVTTPGYYTHARGVSSAVLTKMASIVMRHAERADYVGVALPDQRVRP